MVKDDYIMIAVVAALASLTLFAYSMFLPIAIGHHLP